MKNIPQKLIAAILAVIVALAPATTTYASSVPLPGQVAEENPHHQYTGTDAIYTTYVYKIPHWDAGRQAFVYQDINVQAHSSHSGMIPLISKPFNAFSIL